MPACPPTTREFYASGWRAPDRGRELDRADAELARDSSVEALALRDGSRCIAGG